MTLKKNNISGEYIDLAQLLQNPSVNGDKHNLVFKQGQLMLEPKVKATKINSIEICFLNPILLVI
jgi:hypothetical protein